jgi:hypothetical protein
MRQRCFLPIERTQWAFLFSEKFFAVPIKIHSPIPNSVKGSQAAAKLMPQKT